jgi:hypothetical protein
MKLEQRLGLLLLLLVVMVMVVMLLLLLLLLLKRRLSNALNNWGSDVRTHDALAHNADRMLRQGGLHGSTAGNRCLHHVVRDHGDGIVLQDRGSKLRKTVELHSRKLKRVNIQRKVIWELGLLLLLLCRLRSAWSTGVAAYSLAWRDGSGLGFELLEIQRTGDEGLDLFSFARDKTAHSFLLLKEKEDSRAVA